MSANTQLHAIPVVCQKLSLSRSYVYELIAAGKLQAVKAGRRRMVTEAAIADYIESLTSGSDAA
jgi:excisionase family DNA binding protein